MEYISFVRSEGEGLSLPRRFVVNRALRSRFYVLLAVLDMLAMMLGFIAAGELRFHRMFASEAMIWVGAILPIFLISNAGLMNGLHLRRWQRALFIVLRNLFAAVTLILFVGFALRATTDASRLLLLYGIVVSAGLIIAFRSTVGSLTSHIFAEGITNHILVLDGMAMHCPAKYSVLEIDRADRPDFNNPFLLDSMARRFRDADHVTVACPPERRQAWSMALKGISVRSDLVIPELDMLGSVGQEHVCGSAVVLVSTGPLGTYDQGLKRAMDIAIVGLALAFTLPLLIMTALAIKLDSDGPVFFRQQRVGYGNRLFTMYKFRSMHVATTDESGTLSAQRGDDRVTRVGRFIRATSIDELPQLLNVLRGEMSVVGPRPHALGSLAGDQLFWEVDARYHHRHACKPGLTGLAQVRGFRGATHQREDLVGRLQADLEYLNEWNIWRDLLIVVSTFKVLVHRNAF